MLKGIGTILSAIGGIYLFVAALFSTLLVGYYVIGYHINIEITKQPIEASVKQIKL